MTQAPIGGNAASTKTTTDRSKVKGGQAIRVFVVSDRPVTGGPSMLIYRVSDEEIAAGDFIVAGDKPIPIAEQGEADGDLAQPVYVVTSSSPGDY